MSEQSGNWADGPDDTERGADPVREHLDKAENWLALAEGNRGELVSLHEGTGTYTEVEDAQRWYFATMLESAKDLAELHRAMAQTINDLTPRYVLDSTIDVERAVREQITAENADYVAAMEKRLAAQLKADDEAHQAVTLRPGVDPEPVAEGELWTTGDGWCYYAVASFRTPDDSEAPRWLLVRHYAQVLRWSSEQGTKPMPDTWSEVGRHCAENERLDGQYGTLRRPTAEERAAFYGPEPDPQPAIEEAHERTTTPPPATLGEAFRTPYGGAAKPPEEPVRFDRFDATVEAFSDEALIVMREALNREQGRRIVKRERPQRAYTEPEDRGMFRDRG